MDELFIHLPACESSAYGQWIFIDESMVCEDPGIGAENGLDEFVHIFAELSQFIKFVSTDSEQ